MSIFQQTSKRSDIELNKMLKAYKYRLYPTELQTQNLIQAMGCTRYIYNKAKETSDKHYQETGKTISAFEMITRMLKEEKAANEWLKQPYSQSLQMAVLNFESARSNFLNGISNFPVFKKKTGRDSIQFPQHIKVDFKANRTTLPKLGKVFTVFDRKFDGKIKTCTVSKTPTGKFFISVLVDNGAELPPKSLIKEGTTIGIDLGLKHFATLSNGQKINNPKFLRNQLERLAVLQRRASKKQKGSNNRKKANLRVARLYETITNQRTNFLQQLSTSLIRENQTIVIEDLNIAGLLKNGRLAREISDVSWGSFIRMLTYKAEWYGKNLFQIGRFEPSSKTCSCCDHINEELTLKDREWECLNCHTIHDRDINAAINIKNIGLKNYLQVQSGQELPVEPTEIPCKKKDRRSRKPKIERSL
jgi:putative transposase